MSRFNKTLIYILIDLFYFIFIFKKYDSLYTQQSIDEFSCFRNLNNKGRQKEKSIICSRMKLIWLENFEIECEIEEIHNASSENIEKKNKEKIVSRITNYQMSNDCKSETFFFFRLKISNNRKRWKPKQSTITSFTARWFLPVSLSLWKALRNRRKTRRRVNNNNNNNAKAIWTACVRRIVAYFNSQRVYSRAQYVTIYVVCDPLNCLNNWYGESIIFIIIYRQGTQHATI